MPIAKIVQLSILVAIIAIPVYAARERNAARGLKKAIVHMVYFNLLYLFIILFVHGRLSG